MLRLLRGERERERSRCESFLSWFLSLSERSLCSLLVGEVRRSAVRRSDDFLLFFTGVTLFRFSFFELFLGVGDLDRLRDALRRGLSSGEGDFLLGLLLSRLLSTDFRLDFKYFSLSDLLFGGGDSFLLGSGDGLRFRCSLCGGDSLLSL